MKHSPIISVLMFLLAMLAICWVAIALSVQESNVAPPKLMMVHGGLLGAYIGVAICVVSKMWRD